MHPSGIFREADPARIAALVDLRGLALIIAADPRPAAAHAPVLLTGKTLRFHLSRDNDLVAAIEGSGRVLVVVTGLDAYISPDWYAAADQVPTWNYLSAEIEGPTRAMGRDETRGLLDDLAARFEAGLAPKPPWTRAKMKPAKFESMLGAIVGFEMSVVRFEGISKLSQNKAPAERARVAAALSARDEPGSRGIAKLMREDGSGTGQ